MSVVRAAGPVLVVGVLLSCAIVLVAGVLSLRSADLVGTDHDWATIDGVVAIAFFAFFVGAISTVVGAVVARFFPLGLAGIALVAIGIGIYVTQVALAEKPQLAPMFIVLHMVFVAAFGLLLPYRLWTARRTSTV